MSSLMTEIDKADIMVLFWDGDDSDSTMAESLAAMAANRNIIMLRKKGVKPDFPPSLNRTELVRGIVEYQDLVGEAVKIREDITREAARVVDEDSGVTGKEINILCRSLLRNIIPDISD